ncbi:MAG: hypothetical protein JSV05_01240 [Candidatus Bathyarchaeota archaeon]|nr:MAG: hypothetical protein JSV05_01240 [Candidatus Bathyarchaeota archaeon]
MKAIKKAEILLLGILAVTLVFGAPAKADSSMINLPPDLVTMMVYDGTFSYFDTHLSNVPGGYDVTNGSYLGWCVDRRYTIPRGPTTHEVMLYSSLDPDSLPEDIKFEEWDMINYILNHKQGSMMDIQEAIWYFINMVNGYGVSTPEAQAMVDDALANGAGFMPNPCEIVAIICYPEGETQITIIEFRRCNLKQFTDSGAFDGFTAPMISVDGLGSMVYELHSGPRIWWQVTYHFENSEAFLGEDEYDGEGHYFILWDKWGGNLMALDSQPVAFDSETNMVTLENGEEFNINPRLGVTQDGYKGYIHPSLDISDLASQGNAYISGHIGDQQQGTNPGRGRGSHPRDGKSYDADIRWEIGWLAPGESAELVIYVAPGKNPGHKLQFSSPGIYWINTGPRVRVYGDSSYETFLYAIDKTVQLYVDVE